MDNNLVFHKDTRIILSHERSNKTTFEIYPSNHLLTYVREGLLKVAYGNNTQCFQKGEFVLFKRYTPATITKTWDQKGTRFSSIVFTFQEELIQNAFQQLDLKLEARVAEVEKDVVPIASNPILEQFILSLQLFFDQGLAMDDPMAKLKTLEALIGILKVQPELAPQLQRFTQKSKADLYHYMKLHFLENKDLKAFARASGRSLSSFKKDFNATYQMAPSKWLKQKRLEHAYKLLLHTPKKASDIYLECGFEDLAHFSKSFKAYFNVNPSEIKKAV